MNNLTDSILHTLFVQNTGKNFVFSPASYLEAIYNLSLCLKGKNLDELLSALQFTSDDLVGQIQKAKKASSNLESYNCFLYSPEYQQAMNQEVVQSIINLGSDIKDFSDIDSLIKQINQIVQEKTHGKITNLASRDNINDFVKFVILNCVYFKKNWLHEFESRILPEPFFGSSKTDVIFMYKYGRFLYSEQDGFDIVEIPYQDSDICCYLFVPAPTSSVFSIINNFRSAYDQIPSVSSKLEVFLTVPPFKIESEFNLNDATRWAGVNGIFNWNQDWSLVDFSKLRPETTLAVSDIVQKTHLDFTKKGTEAAAATMITCCVTGCYSPFIIPEIKDIRADKPFVFCLADKNHKETPLFVGVVNNV